MEIYIVFVRVCLQQMCSPFRPWVSLPHQLTKNWTAGLAKMSTIVRICYWSIICRVYRAIHPSLLLRLASVLTKCIYPLSFVLMGIKKKTCKSSPSFHQIEFTKSYCAHFQVINKKKKKSLIACFKFKLKRTALWCGVSAIMYNWWLILVSSVDWVKLQVTKRLVH